MITYETNTITAIKFFKNNAGKMVAFIIVAMLFMGIISHKYYVNNDKYTSVVTIRINEGIFWDIKIISQPHLDLLYFLENKKVKNISISKDRNSSRVIKIEVHHKSLDQVNNKDVSSLKTLLQEYDEILIDRLNTLNNIKIKNLEAQILKNNDNDLVKGYLYNEIALILSDQEVLLNNLKNDNVYYFEYDGKIIAKKAKRIMVKNLLIAFMISIILIILSLWIKLLIREINKNSKLN
jgi:hypothetical protein